MLAKTNVVVTKFAEKQLRRLPKHIKEALYYWVFMVEAIGIREARKFAGYHDEPLRGSRAGQRSVRLNRSYRVIYVETQKELEIQVIEVMNHEY